MNSLKPIIHYKKSRKVGNSVNVEINSTMKTYIHNILLNFKKKKEKGRKFFSKGFRKQHILSHDDEHAGSLILDVVGIFQWKCGLQT